MLLTDFYKVDHRSQYPVGTTLVYSNFTPRKSRIKGVEGVVVFGIQYFIKEYLMERFKKDFFMQTREKAVRSYKRILDNSLGKDAVNVENIGELWDLQYIPLRIKALPEGSICPIGVPCCTIVNTKPEFYWLTNFVESIFSTTVWGPMTSATIAREYRKILEEYADKTGGNREFIDWQAHDFSLRGMFGLEACMMSGAGHLLSFKGTDSIPAICFLEEYYNANSDTELIGGSVSATEHSVMCAEGRDGEPKIFKRLLTEVYPDGICSIVSDTYDLFNVLTVIMPSLKTEIMARNGKFVVRPDSGDPVEILCGIEICDLTDDKYVQKLEDCSEWVNEFVWDKVREETPHGEYGESEYNCIFKYDNIFYSSMVDIEWNRYDKQYYYIDGVNVGEIIEVTPTPAQFGVIELLWNEFGGTINEKGYKEVDSHVGAIYGDSITLDRCRQIMQRLMNKGFVSTSVVLGVGSYTYQYNTRDTFGFAMKATYCEVGDDCREIFKDPKTDDGTKKSKKGLLRVYREDGTLKCQDQVSWAEEATGELVTVFEDGVLVVDHTLAEIRKRVQLSLE